jgi:hypothetical protein
LPFLLVAHLLNLDQIEVSHLIASGQVYNLDDPARFSGRYFLISGGIDGNNGQSKLRNQNDVWVHLEG